MSVPTGGATIVGRESGRLQISEKPIRTTAGLGASPGARHGAGLTACQYFKGEFLRLVC